jgi:hypothetical protein
MCCPCVCVCIFGLSISPWTKDTKTHEPFPRQFPMMNLNYLSIPGPSPVFFGYVLLCCSMAGPSRDRESQTFLDLHGSSWTVLDLPGPSWTFLDLLGQGGPDLPGRSRTVQEGPGMSRMVWPSCPGRSRKVEKGPKQCAHPLSFAKHGHHFVIKCRAV